MVREQKPMGRDKRTRAAVVEAYGSQSEVIEKGGGNLEVVFVRHHLLRELVEQPQALVRARGGAKANEKSECGNYGQSRHGYSHFSRLSGVREGHFPGPG
jgi:hypothetical protein